MFTNLLEAVSSTDTRQKQQDKPCSHLTSELTHCCNLRRRANPELVNDTSRLQPHSANTQSLITRTCAQEVLTSFPQLSFSPRSLQLTRFQAIVGATSCPARGTRLKQEVCRMLLLTGKNSKTSGICM